MTLSDLSKTKYDNIYTYSLKVGQMKIKLLFFGGYILAVLVLDIFFRILIGDQGIEKLKWVEHTHKVLYETKNLLSAMTDAETGQRGYLLTDDESYLEPYHRGLRNTKISFQELSSLTSDNINQVKRLSKIKELMDVKVAELKYTTELGNKEKVITLIKKNEGKIVMDKIRLVVFSVINEEQELLRIRQEEFQNKTVQNFLIVRVSSFILTFILFFMLYVNYIQKKKLSLSIIENKKKDQLMEQQSRLAQMGEMISMIAHQWRQPLAAISARSVAVQLKLDIESLNEDISEADKEKNRYLVEEFIKIDASVQSLSTTIDDFRNFYKPNKLARNIELSQVVNKSLDIIRISLENDNILVNIKDTCKNKINIYDTELMQVILNLLKNAQDNFKEKQTKHPQITIEITDHIIVVQDNGGGIDEEIGLKIFDPYFSTKSEKNGTGLGLYMSKTIVEKHHGGSLTAVNTNDGVKFSVQI